MVKYSLVARNVLDGNTTILIEKKPLIEIDKFVYGFDSEKKLKNYYQLDENYRLQIKYVYNRIARYLELILKNGSNHVFKNVLDYTNGNSIPLNLSAFEKYINDFINSFDQSELDFLFKYQYIDSWLYYNLLDYIGSFNLGDQQTIIYNVKSTLRRYINFRKLYLGVYNFKHNIVPEPFRFIPDEKKKVCTENEYLDNLYNNGGLDVVYSLFDLEDLQKIDGAEQLGIDGIAFTKKNSI